MAPNRRQRKISRQERIARAEKARKKQRRSARNTGFYQFRTIVPNDGCEDCQLKGDKDDIYFHKAGDVVLGQIYGAGAAAADDKDIEHKTREEPSERYFRFLELPPQIRNRIYELVVYRPKQPACVPNRLICPSDNLGSSRKVLRECSTNVVCLPCQLHDILETGHLGLSRASVQLHKEMALVAYTVNTFSVHNLYYLQIVLRLIGREGRTALRSPNIEWKLHGEEARPLKMFTSLGETDTLLAECKTLSALSVRMDVDNLLVMKGSGKQRDQPKNSVDEIPYISLISQMRGLKEIKIAWKVQWGLTGMEDWAKTLTGHWRLPRGSNGTEAIPASAEVEDSEDNRWRFIRWDAAKDSLSGNLAMAIRAKEDAMED